MPSINFDTGQNNTQQKVQQDDVMSRAALRALMDSDKRIRKLLESLAWAYSGNRLGRFGKTLSTDKLFFLKDSEQDLAWLVDNFSIEQKGHGRERHVVFSSKHEAGKTYSCYANKIIFNDNNNNFEIHDAHEMVLLAKMNPKFSGALHLQGSPEQKYMLYLNCEKLDVPVNPQSIADLNQIPDDVKQEIESKFENLQQELINNKAEKIYSEIEQGFEPFKAAVNNLTQANTIDEAIQRHYNAREAQKEFLEKYADKIGVLETLVKDNNEPQTQSLEDITLTEEGINDFSIKQKFDVLTSSYSQYSDGLSAHENDFIPSLFAAAQARDNLSSNVDEANDIHENIQNLEKYIQDQIDNHQFDEAEDILNKADNLISTNLINYINALEDSIKAVNGSLFTAPQKYHSEIKSLIEPDSDAMTAHHLLQEILHGAPKTFSDLKEKLSLQMAHHNFKHAWQEIEEHYVEMHNDLSHQQSNKVKLPHNSLQSIQEKLEQLKSTEYYTTQDHQKEALQELNSLEQLAMDTIQKYNRVSDQSFKIIELYGNELRSLTSSQLGETLSIYDQLSSTHKQNCSALSSLEKALQQEFQTVSTDIQNKSLSRGKTQDANNISGTYSEPPHSDEYGIRAFNFVKI